MARGRPTRSTIHEFLVVSPHESYRLEKYCLNTCEKLMPRIFDNIEQSLLPALRETVQLADRADFCVGYFNLRGWKQLDWHIEKWAGDEGHCCWLLVGMQRLPQDEVREALSLINRDGAIDNQTAIRLKKKLAEEFRDQLSPPHPTPKIVCSEAMDIS